MLSPAVDEIIQGISFSILEEAWDDALQLCADAEARGLTDFERAHILHLRAQVSLSRKHFEAAIDLLQRAIPLFQGNDHASALGNLGFALDHVKEYERALGCHKTCLEALTKECGPNHVRVVRKLGDAAFSLIGLGRLNEAETLLRDAVKRSETTREADAMSHARPLMNLGYFLLRSASQPGEALRCFDDVEALRAKASLRFGGRMVREGFPIEFAETLRGARAETLADLEARSAEDGLTRRRTPE